MKQNAIINLNGDDKMSYSQVRNGRYCLYNGKLYKLESFNSSTVTLLFDSGTKIIPRNWIDGVYKIETRAVYMGESFQIIGGRNGTNLLTLCSRHIRHGNVEDCRYRDKLVSMGFDKGPVEKGYCDYVKQVPINDQYLELAEDKKEIELN